MVSIPNESISPRFLGRESHALVSRPWARVWVSRSVLTTVVDLAEQTRMIGRQLWRRYMLQGGGFALALAPLAVANLGATLAISGEQWRDVLVVVGLLIWPLFGLGMVYQQRLVRPYLNWLDHSQSQSQSQSHSAEQLLSGALQFPIRLGISSFLVWLAGGLLVALVGLVKVEGFGGFESCAALICSAGAGLMSSLFSYSTWNRLSRSSLRRLVADAGLGARREGFVRFPIGRKLQLAFFSTSLLPMMLVLLLVTSRSSELVPPLLLVTITSSIFSVILSRAIAGELTATTAQISEALRRAAAGDLREATWVETDDEFGDAARASDRLMAEFHDALAKATSMAEAVERARRNLETISDDVMSASMETANGVEQTLASVVQIDSQGREIASQADQLFESVRISTTSIESLQSAGAAIRSLSARALRDSSTSIDALELIATKSTTIAHAADQLATSSEAAKAATTQLDQSATEIGERARAAEGIASVVRDLSADGRRAVRAVGNTMRSIEDSVENADSRARLLDERMDEIGEVVAVIDEIAGTTQLLALNAAIIAAKAGESGQAFNVVATEVRALASRVGTKIREIEGITDGLRASANEAAAASQASRGAVAEGIQRSEEAETLLGKIAHSAAESGEHATAIGNLLEEHSAGTKQLNQLVSHVADETFHITEHTAKQLSSQEGATAAAAALRLTAESVHESADDQAQSLLTLREVAESVEDSSLSIREALASQASDSNRSTIALNEVTKHAKTSSQALGDLADAISSLRERSATMRGFTARFITQSSQADVDGSTR